MTWGPGSHPNPPTFPIRALLFHQGQLLSTGGDSKCGITLWQPSQYQQCHRCDADSFGPATCLAVMPWNKDKGGAGAAGAGGLLSSVPSWHAASGHVNGQVLIWEVLEGRHLRLIMTCVDKSGPPPR